LRDRWAADLAKPIKISQRIAAIRSHAGIIRKFVMRSIGIPGLFAGLTAATLLAAAGAGFAQGSTPLSLMAGSWSGTGNITLSDNTRERLRCRSSYKPDASGNTMVLSLTCASDSYKFDLASNVTYSGGQISGNWSESTRAAAGNLSGTANGGNVEARVEGQTFAAFISLSTRGDQQSISIRAPGSAMKEVAITLSRGK
jgi:hypothetical protein